MMQFPHTKAILFDWDLTLVQPFPVIRRALRKIAQRYDIDVSQATMRELYGEGSCTILLANLYELNKDKLPSKEQFVNEMLDEFVHGHRALEFTHEPVLKTLRGRGYKLGLVTFNVLLNVSAVLKKSGFTFDVYITWDSMEKHASKAIGMQDAMKLLDVTPRQTLYVGDTLHDIQFAHEAGVSIVAVTTGVYTKDELREAKPDAIIDHMSELESLFI